MGREKVFTQSLDLENGIPIYSQIVSIVKQNIMTDILKPGDLLPSEIEFCNRYGISRTSVRQAFAVLEKEGLIDRQKGKGTFVRDSLSRSLNNLYSFTDEMTRLGLDTDSKLLSFELTDINPKYLEYFTTCDTESKMYSIKRLRNVGGRPLSIETVYMPVKYCPLLSPHMLEHMSLYDILYKLSNIIPMQAFETYKVTNLGKAEAKLLESREGSAAFYVKRRTLDTRGECFELAYSVLRGDRCSYKIDLKRDNILFGYKVD